MAGGGALDGGYPSGTYFIYLDADKYPDAALHVIEARAAGHPLLLTLDKDNNVERGKQARKGYPIVDGYDRDEYPPAFSLEGGLGASIKYIPSSDNRGAGASLGNQIRSIPDHEKVVIVVVSRGSVVW